MSKRSRAWLELLLNALDIQTLDGYHASSFEDPPSYHEDVADLWDCPMCVEAYMRRSHKVLAAVRADITAGAILG